MDWKAITAVVTAALTLVGGGRRFTRKNERLRSRIERELDLLAKLEADSQAGRSLTQHIDESVRELVALERLQDKRRTDPYGLIWMVVFVGIAAAVTVYILQSKHDWWVEALLWLVVAVFVL